MIGMEPYHMTKVNRFFIPSISSPEIEILETSEERAARYQRSQQCEVSDPDEWMEQHHHKISPCDSPTFDDEPENPYESYDTQDASESDHSDTGDGEGEQDGAPDLQLRAVALVEETLG